MSLTLQNEDDPEVPLGVVSFNMWADEFPEEDMHKAACDAHQWISWVLSSSLSFTFAAAQETRANVTGLLAMTPWALICIMEATVKAVKHEIFSALPKYFGLMLDQ